MKILVLTTSYPRWDGDDAGIFVLRLAAALAERGQIGKVVVPFDEMAPGDYQAGKFQIERFKYGIFSSGRLAFGAGIMPNLRSKPWLILQAPGLIFGFISRLLKYRREYELVHANWILTAWAAWAASFLIKIKYFVTLRGEDVRLLDSKLGRLIFLPCLNRAAGVVTVSESLRDQVVNTFQLDAGRVHCIPNGVGPVGLEAASPSPGMAKPARPYLLFVGTIIPRKRIEVLIDLLAQPELKKFDLVLIGRTDNSAYVDAVLTRAREKGVLDRLSLKGMIAPRDVAAYLANCSVYISASEYEGRSNSLLEAMAAGCLVFVSDIPSHREIVVDAENGLLFDVGNLELGASKLLNCTAAGGMADRLRQNARKSVSNLTWEKCAQKYVELFEKSSS